MGSPIIVVGGIAVFAVLLIIVGIRRRDSESTAEEVMERMGRFATREDFLALSEGSGGRHEANKVAQGLEEIFKSRPVADKTASLLTQADVHLTIGEFLLIRVAVAGGGFLLGFLLGGRLSSFAGLLIGVLLAFFGFVGSPAYLSFKAKRRRKAFINQLGDTISLMANSLRAGYSLLQTMELVSRETKDPIAGEFRRVVREVGLGISHQDAMANLLRRVPSDDLDLLITAINIQHEVGGNLAQILTTIGHTIRERVRIKGEIGVLTAQVKYSSYIVTLMPPGLAVIIFMLNPQYIGGLFVWPWICMPIASAFMVTIGFFAMRKIANIEV